MEKRTTKRLSRQDWVRGGIEVLQERGVAGIKIVALAERLGVTSGSFYWHFKGLRSLLDSLLEYWEVALTDAIIVSATGFGGSPEERILHLMVQVIEGDAAALDHAIMVWARNDPAAQEAFERTLQKRFDFARWMFKQAGFSNRQATIRGRLMVTHLMGESSTSLKSNAKWKAIVREEFEVLINPIG
jgi:AcrR family transcriptional regulator